MKRLLAILPLLLVLVTGCAQIKPSEMPTEGPLVAVKVRRLGAEFKLPVRAAFHGLIDVRDAEGNCQRFEVVGKESNETMAEIAEADLYADTLEGRPVAIRTLVTGPKAVRIIEDLRKNAMAYEDYLIYRPVPGPNSNTFVETMLRQSPELIATLPHSCVGKDFSSTFLFGVPGSKDGIEFETAFVGFEIGYRKGFEFHFIGTTLGIRLFPPAISIPGVPRLGFPDPQRIDRSEEYEHSAK